MKSWFRVLHGLLVTGFLLASAAAHARQGPDHDEVGRSSSQSYPGWAFEGSDVSPDPGYHFGRLSNGLRYVVRANRNPKGLVQVRMDVAAGSLDETPAEQGFAHFVEHMAFNGSTHFTEGDMIRTLERHGLSNGADTNAATDFEETSYQFDLPSNKQSLVRLAITLMREIATELTFEPGAVERARGVVLAEMRERNTWQRRTDMDEARFRHPRALYPWRFSIGTPQTLAAASPDDLRHFWQRVYVPQRTTVIVIGDVDPAAVEKEIRARFGTWRQTASPPQPDPGPIDASDHGRTRIYLEPPISERVIATRHGGWIDGRDTLALRNEKWLRLIAYNVVNRRLKSLSRRPDPPFRDARLVTGGVFQSGRSTNLIVDTVDGTWRAGLVAAATEYRRAVAFGFSADEVAEQVATLHANLELAARAAATRSNSALAGPIIDMLRLQLVPASPESEFERFVRFEKSITPQRVYAALLRDCVPLVDPLLRLEGSWSPEGGEPALRSAWNEAMQVPVVATKPPPPPVFGYSHFGAAGTVQSDTRDALFGIRRIRFANGVMLNLKRTRLEKGRVRVQVNLDGGEMLNTAANPTVTQLARVLPVGGLGKNTLDELQSIRAGHVTDFGFGAGTETFVSMGMTTSRDLLLQMQLYAALLADPGYREEGEIEYRLNINNYFNGLLSTPSSALNSAMGGIVSDHDPRFTLQPVETYRALTFRKLREDISDRLAHGAIEIGVVGDIDEPAVIAAVARTFGALPPREREFRPYEPQRTRTFTSDRSSRIVWHRGPQDQALLRYTWPTRDDSDPVQSLSLDLLARVVLIELTEELRQRLGKAYAPEASSNPSRYYRFGAFGIAVMVGVKDVPAARAAIQAVIARLRNSTVSSDVFTRARAPMLESAMNALKTNGGWMWLVSRAQGKPERLDRQRRMLSRIRGLRSDDVLQDARHYLTADALEVLVLPEGSAAG